MGTDKADIELHEEYATREHGQETLADLANQEEHEYTTWQAIKKNPKPFIWCMFCVWITLLVSFENQASGYEADRSHYVHNMPNISSCSNVLGIPEFRKVNL